MLAWFRRSENYAGVGEVAGAEQHASLRALELGEPLLEPAVDRHVARDEARRSRARAVSHRGLGGGLALARVIGEAQVVVRAEKQDGPAVEQDARSLGAGDDLHAPVEAGAPDLGEPLLDLGHAASGLTCTTSG